MGYLIIINPNNYVRVNYKAFYTIVLFLYLCIGFLNSFKLHSIGINDFKELRECSTLKI